MEFIIDNFYDVNRRVGTFSADGALGGKWDDRDEERCRCRIWSVVKPGSEGVLMSFESMGIYSINDISSNSAFATESADPPSSLVGCQNRQSADFSATFKMDQVDYRKFPFEEFYLPIRVTTESPIHAIFCR